MCGEPHACAAAGLCDASSPLWPAVTQWRRHLTTAADKDWNSSLQGGAEWLVFHIRYRWISYSRLVGVHRLGRSRVPIVRIDAAYPGGLRAALAPKSMLGLLGIEGPGLHRGSIQPAADPEYKALPCLLSVICHSRWILSSLLSLRPLVPHVHIKADLALPFLLFRLTIVST
ncbi:hypothetical protein BDV96DRAFT_8180 [Lophiotrema nucula]|uniref:Uncharacterized protein n=1 Tax=Lophiotrema nucula TaxID=690887 RepID=A0A6A5ZT27_9PLEO|nr:hypothetical protein BDV96DRAFT_8180 [Lophiotrema nucula]